MDGIPQPCSAFHGCFARKQSLCVFTLFPLPQIDRFPYNPLSVLCSRCVYRDFQYTYSLHLPASSLRLVLVYTLLKSLPPACRFSDLILGCGTYYPDEVKLHPCLATLCLSGCSRHIACSGVSLKFRPKPEIEMYSNPGSIGLDPKLPLTSREKNLKRIPT